MKYEILNEGIENNFKYSGVEYKSDGKECNDSDCGCRDGDYCRRNKYIGLEVESIDLFSVRKHFLESSKRKKDTIDIKNVDFIEYCVDRLLRIHKVYIKDNWEIITCSGYYGEEIESIYLSNFKEIVDKIVKVINLPPDKRIEFILNEEYQFLIDSVKNKKWKQIIAPTNKLKIGNQEYRKKVDAGIYDENYDLPIGIFIKDGEFFKLIDGYHRFAAAIDKKDKVDIIFGE